MAKASMFWVLHMGRMSMSGPDTAHDFRTYRTDANVLRARSRHAIHRGSMTNSMAASDPAQFDAHAHATFSQTPDACMKDCVESTKS
eukprot:5791468-Pleurochrysis_carterae.AAC.1